MGTSIDIAVSCTFFQHRLCWMASSLLQQCGDVPDIVLSVAYPRHNGVPSTETVCDFFENQGLKIRRFPYEGMSKIQFRGLVRNDQLQASDCEWMIFADADMTYDPLFFEHLSRQLQGDLKNETRVISARRISLDKDFCKNYFNTQDHHQYPCIVERSGELKSWPIFQISKSCGAGYFQLVNRQHIMQNCGGLYVDPLNCKDWSWKTKGQKANSDRQFRHRVGGVKHIHTMPQYHLNHERDNEAGVHLEHQR